MAGAEWWDDYDCQPHVVIDDFAPDQLEPARFKNLFDRYPMSVPIKGGFRPWIPKLVVITSNVDPASWYTTVVNGESIPDAAVQRRLDEVHLMDEPYEYKEEYYLSAM